MDGLGCDEGAFLMKVFWYWNYISGGGGGKEGRKEKGVMRVRI